MAKKKIKKNKISYGKVELEKDEFDSKYTKVRITTFVDLDVLQTLKKLAKTLNIGYQTLLNEKLRESVLNEEPPDKNIIKNVIERLEKLEKKIV